MITPRHLIQYVGYGIICTLLFAPTLSTAGFFQALFPKNDLEAITVTDMYPAGSLRRQPSPAKPVYYAAISGGLRDLGDSKAGEKPVPREFVTDTMMKVLAKQGYLPAAPGQRPDLILVWTWGTFNTSTYRFTGLSIVQNRHQLMKFMGGDKLGLNASPFSGFSEQLLMPGSFYYGIDAQRLYDAAGDDLYIAVISAYDANSKDPKKPIMLWNTRVACPSRGFWLKEALPGMMAIAGPFIGRDTPKPVWVRSTDRFRPDIQLGDTKLVEYLEQSTANVTNVGVSR